MKYLLNILTIVLFAILGCSRVAADTFTVAFELEWGKGKLANWDGGVEITNGSINSVWNTRLEGTERVWKETDSIAKWTSTTAGATDGIGIEIVATSSSELIFKSLMGVKKFKVKNLIREPLITGFKGGKEKLSIGLSRKHTIWAENTRDSYVFHPREKWSVEWGLNLVLPFIGDSIRYTLEVTDDRTGRVMPASIGNKVPAQGMSQVQGKDIVSVPAREGVYSAWVKIVNAPIDVPDLRIQFVVVDPEYVSNSIEGTEKSPKRLVDQVAAAEQLGSERFRGDGTSRVVQEGGLSYRQTGTKATRTSKKNDDSRTMNWFAYRMKVDNPGVAHILEVDYPQDRKQRFVISVLEHNPPGKSRNRMDLGVVSYGSQLKGPRLKTKRIVFWPTTTQPAIAIVNTLDGSHAAISNIRLFELPEVLPVERQTIPDESNTLLGPYFEETHLYRSLGAKKASDSSGRLSTMRQHDWLTFYDAVIHLAEMLRYRGENAVMLPVFTYGSTLYPSRYLPNNGRYDGGIYFNDGRDVVQKDVVRLMLEIFERNNLKLTPVFAFYSTLPRLEAYRDSAKPRSAIDLINREGISVREKLGLGSKRTFGPYYDPLHPRVQEEIEAVLMEFAERYGGSPALGDIAFQLNTTGWLQYPGLGWGYGAKTVSSFFAETGLSANLAGQGEQHDIRQVSRALNQAPLRPKWLEWRNDKLGEYFASLGDRLQQTAGRKLVLAYMNIFSSRFREDHPVEAIKKGWTPRDLLAVKGVDPFILGKSDNVRLWRPIRTQIPFDTRKLITMGKVSHSPQSVSMFIAAGSDGAVEFHDYFETKLASIEKNWWWPLDYRMVATITEPGTFYRQRQAADTAFFTGGWQMVQ